MAGKDMALTVCVPGESDREHLHPVPDGVRVLVWDGSGAQPDGLADTEFLLATYMGGDDGAELVAALPRLKVIQLTSAGVERWLPLVPEGVTLCNGRGIHGGATAELAVAGVLALTRELPGYLADQASATWSPHATDDLDEADVLVLGAGDIARRAAAALEVFGARIRFVARTARDGVHGIDELPALLGDTRVLVIAVPLTDRTRGLIDADALAALPDGAIVANVSRGPIVDTDALLAQLQAGRLRAFLDVTDPEPLPADHPLWQAPNLIITPHVGGGTHGWERRAFRLVRDQIERYLRGDELRNTVGTAY